MRTLTSRDIVIELLRTLAEVQVTWNERHSGDGVLLMPSAYREGSYMELERCLREMRENGRRSEWWHVCSRYRWGTVQRTVVRYRLTLKGRRPLLPPRAELVLTGEVLPHRLMVVYLYTWAEQVDPLLVERGLERLLGMMYDGDHSRLRLPDVFLWRALGVPAPAERRERVAS